jgi:membrane-associated phospholipid phosphatase/tRNA A-37 threonylcarbamoyl transferase component Bud32
MRDQPLEGLGPAAGKLATAAAGGQGRTAPIRQSLAVGRRRRPSGEPPPLPHSFGANTGIGLALIAIATALSVAMRFDKVAAVITGADDAVLRWVSTLRTPALTDLLSRTESLGSSWTIRVIGWATIVTLLVFRRFRHLTAYLVVLLGCSLLGSVVANVVGRMRPSGVRVLGGWDGFSFPSRPVIAFAVVLVGALHTLIPAGRLRHRVWFGALTLIALLGASRLYLGVDHPTDIATGAIIGCVIPLLIFEIIAPDEAFPVTYRRGRKAHIDLGGRRGQAIAEALQHQLGISAVAVEPFGLSGSAGSTPLRIRLSGDEGNQGVLFGKLYALNHLRSDRWYKLVRTVLYGRLEDEKPFSTVRRLTEYEDHMLRIFRDEGLPTPKPHGFVEITPEREYVIVMEYLEGAREMDRAEVDDKVIAAGLAAVRRMWDVGIAHRDIKPSNLLVRHGEILLIDVAFAAVRPTPWRQAVDLADMMLTLALCSSAERAYQSALDYFTPEEIAESFAATRSITVPTQLRSRLRECGRDIVKEFKQLVPPRPPVSIQLWDLRRLYVAVALLAGLAAAIAGIATYLQTTSLL